LEWHARLGLLVWRQTGHVYRVGSITKGNSARHEPIVISPSESNPRIICPRLILHVCGLLKLLVMVDAEGARCCEIRAQAADLRIEEARVDAAQHDKRG
jgi:hypothetical protein